MRILTTMAIIAGLLGAGAFARADHHEHEHDHKLMLPTQGVAVILPTKGNKVKGVLKLQQKGDTLHITGRIRGLTPGKHGFHIHEYGDLTAADGTSAGGHFNPTGAPHAGPDADKRHAGDLGNIEADEKGVAMVKVMVKEPQLHFIVGRSFVVHAGADDLKSQPSGDAGPRVGVGVIGITKPMEKKKPKQDAKKDEK